MLAIPHDPDLSGVYGVHEDGGHYALVSTQALMSIPEVRGRLARLLKVESSRLVFKMLQPGQGPNGDALTSMASTDDADLHQMVFLRGDVGDFLSKTVAEMLPEGSIVSASDSVRDLDGDSLFCLELSEVLQEALDADIDPIELYRCRSLGELVERLEAPE